VTRTDAISLAQYTRLVDGKREGYPHFLNANIQQFRKWGGNPFYREKIVPRGIHSTGLTHAVRMAVDEQREGIH